jgi:hypothetical protein
MIQLNTVYSIDNGANSIIFTEGKKDSVTGTHNDGMFTGFIEGNVLKGTFHNTKVNATGLIEVTFHESGFDAKWKNGMEPGLMRGKWVGKLESKISKPEIYADSATEFIKYINENYEFNQSYGDTLDKISTEDFIEKYSIEFSNDFFGNLKKDLGVVKIIIDNSEYSIEEQDGSDRFTIYYDFKHNCIYQQFPSNSDDYYKYLGTCHASISSFYKESEKFYGCYSICNLNNEWEIQFQGDYESHEGSISEEIVFKIKEYINSTNFYLFINEVIDCF